MKQGFTANERILIVDDVPQNIQILGTILREYGYDILFARDGLQALVQVESDPPDLILMDVTMPDMDGFETCKRLKKMPEAQDIPVIFLTARAATEDHVKGFESGGVDYVTKPFKTLELLARIRTHLQLRREIQERKRREAQMAIELKRARKIQESLLPKKLPTIPNVHIFTKFVPMEQVGGDFYQIIEQEQGKIGIVLADVTGHGIPAALISFMVSSIFTDCIQTGRSPADVMDLANKKLIPQFPIGNLASIFYAVYDPATKMMNYVNAGHPSGLLLRSGEKDIIELGLSGTMVGILQHAFEEKTVQMVAGDKLLLYTDAIIDARDDTDKRLGMKNFSSFIFQHHQVPMEELLDKVYDYGLKYGRYENYEDDFTLVGLQIN